ncbi:tetratricopeptide repeat protein [Sphingomonas sp. 28-63-12]|uniref:tetratricopeptide repeat protein n=1 Tax=Sphingomonas sp. 28-63-12 TaxID=1970434 RepID=UPI000BD0475D|nr:MAG: hypothetical protein B7Y47_02540 [Sphingomonas sp. 28-63-12]
MAVTPQTNEAFLREVDEELRRDQAMHFWTRYGRWLIGAVVLGLAVFAGVLVWQNQRQKQAGEQGEQLAAMFEKLGSGDEKAATKPLADLAANGVGGYRSLARFTQADILLQKNDLKGAAAKFAEVANDTSAAQPFRDLALIRQTYAEYDSLKPQTVIDRLKPLAVPGGAWFGSAGELVAIAQLKLNQKRAAGDLFGRIARDQTVPESLRQRAVQMAGELGVDAVEQIEEKKPQ